ncbi:MAG: glycosyltransferase family 2 protein [Alphaproteobacteria bacterium]|nr:MAG: glycosyltransferase family 2 protein [Alphaproteobacteria bacterium]
MGRASVHVVIVNWNSGAQLRECLQSFEAVAGDDVTVRITVIDNASADGSAENLQTAVPLAVIRNEDNRGFAAACNQGAAGSDAEYLLFLNPDTQLMPGSLERPARYLASEYHENVGVVSIQLVDMNGNVARNTAREPIAWSLIGNGIGLDRLMPSVFPPHFVTDWAHDETRPVDQVMGAFLFVRRDVFEALGGFDERFFVYYEDLDFALRARQRGWSSVYLASARAFHRGQGTSEAVPERRTFYFCRSKMLFALKYFNPIGAFGVILATLVLEPLARVAAAPRSAGNILRAFGMLWKDLPDILRSSRS